MARLSALGSSSLFADGHFRCGRCLAALFLAAISLVARVKRHTARLGGPSGHASRVVRSPVTMAGEVTPARCWFNLFRWSTGRTTPGKSSFATGFASLSRIKLVSFPACVGCFAALAGNVLLQLRVHGCKASAGNRTLAGFIRILDVWSVGFHVDLAVDFGNRYVRFSA